MSYAQSTNTVMSLRRKKDILNTRVSAKERSWRERVENFLGLVHTWLRQRAPQLAYVPQRPLRWLLKERAVKWAGPTRTATDHGSQPETIASVITEVGRVDDRDQSVHRRQSCSTFVFFSSSSAETGYRKERVSAVSTRD